MDQKAENTNLKKRKQPMMCFYARLGLVLEMCGKVLLLWVDVELVMKKMRDRERGVGGQSTQTVDKGHGSQLHSYHRKGRLLWEEGQDLMEVKQS